MNYSFHTKTDKKQFDEFVMNSDQNNLFQCSNWVLIKDNWNHLLTSVTDEDGNIVATALILIRPLIFKYTMMYIPRGPVMDYHNEQLVKFMITSLKKLSRHYHAAVIRFDPSILTRKYPYTKRHEKPAEQNLEIIRELKKLGCKHRGFTKMIAESTQPRFNAEMDVTSDYREHLEHKTLKCIRTAVHKGIEVYEGPQYIDDFSIAMHYTETRKKIALRNEDYFENMLEVYGNHAILMVSKLNFPKQLKKLEQSIAETKEQLSGQLTKKETNRLKQSLKNDEKEYERLKEDYAREGKDEVITSGILGCYNKNLMELFYMGNNPDYLRMYSSYLLYAKCLDRCVELGITHCSFGGIEGTLDDGLTLFKSNWIMNVEEYIGEFNIVHNHLIYKLFNEVYPKLLSFTGKFRSLEK